MSMTPPGVGMGKQRLGNTQCLACLIFRRCVLCSIRLVQNLSLLREGPGVARRACAEEQGLCRQ